jgi:hypothetical protein
MLNAKKKEIKCKMNKNMKCKVKLKKMQKTSSMKLAFASYLDRHTLLLFAGIFHCLLPDE